MKLCILCEEHKTTSAYGICYHCTKKFVIGENIRFWDSYGKEIQEYRSDNYVQVLIEGYWCNLDDIRRIGKAAVLASIRGTPETADDPLSRHRFDALEF